MKVANVFAGFLVGAAVGAGLVLLLTPRSGAEVQQAIRDRAESALAQGQEAAEMRRLELTERLESLKQPPASSAR
jgi:gas vesicle protein